MTEILRLGNQLEFNMHYQSKVLKHTSVLGSHSVMSWVVCLGHSRLVITMLEVSALGLKKTALGMSRYRDVNPVPTSPLANDLATVPLGPVGGIS